MILIFKIKNNFKKFRHKRSNSERDNQASSKTRRISSTKTSKLKLYRSAQIAT